VTAADLMDVVAGLRRVVRRRLRPTMPDPPLRGAQIELLRVVETQPGIGVSAAAKVLYLADNSVSTLVNQLVGAGWLDRQVDPADRRAARLDLTDAARDRLSRWRAGRTELVEQALGTLPHEDVKAIESALPALRRLLATLEGSGTSDLDCLRSPWQR
jgi:DNA-binding MarR family transcriptional regulator